MCSEMPHESQTRSLMWLADIGEPTSQNISRTATTAGTYDHRYWRTRDPVRSPIDKPVIAELVVGWVTTSESSVLYVLLSSF
jgi:hypothetical protein